MSDCDFCRVQPQRTLTDNERAELLARIRHDRIVRAGEPAGDKREARRAAWHSMRLSGYRQSCPECKA